MFDVRQVFAFNFSENLFFRSTENERNYFSYRYSWGRLARTLICLSISIFTLLITINDAKSIMADPVNLFREATASERTKINSLKKFYFSTIKNSEHIAVQEYENGSTSFFFVRFCRFDFTGYCLTSFFINEISDVNFVGAGMFPGKTTLSDVSYELETFVRQPCENCGKIFVLVFSGSSGPPKYIGISKSGLLF